MPEDLKHTAAIVALRKESVDRNMNAAPERLANFMSLSARRAWIEIWFEVKECYNEKTKSLSARRAWIEITGTWQLSTWHASRSPQGERG